jgi:acyl-coenzyme A synthetase/AMP-(fatty) acid ligase
MNLFFRDTKEKIEKSWDELISDLNQTKIFKPICYSESFYEIFKSLILSLIVKKKIILVDSDFTEDELLKMTGLSKYEILTKNEKCAITKIKDKDELLRLIETSEIGWEIQLYTSGTTGVPKQVTHTFESISRFVKKNPKYCNDCWGFAYNPTHMAGIQVFFQALLNGSAIVRIFGLGKDEIYKEIVNQNITHISATPTFYRLLLPTEVTCESVIRITFGGERFDNNTLDKLRKVFPNAKLNNVYASTEAGSLFASENDCFIIKSDLEHLIKINNEELYIHKSLLGNFNQEFSDDWYATGDLVEIVDTNPLKFRFKNRKNEMINVGGYKVNPSEVEDEIRTINGVVDVKVYSKDNSVLGKIICADVICKNADVNEEFIRTILRTRLQEHKIPRYFKFVQELELTRTGKIKR